MDSGTATPRHVLSTEKLYHRNARVNQHHPESGSQPPCTIEKSMTRAQHMGIVASGVAHLAFGPMPANQFIDEFFSSKLSSTVQSVFEEGMFKDLVGLFSGSYKENDMYQPFVCVLF